MREVKKKFFYTEARTSFSFLSFSPSFIRFIVLFLPFSRSLPFLSHLLVIPEEIEFTFQERTRLVHACVTLRPYGRACLSGAHACSCITLVGTHDVLCAGASSTMTTVSFAGSTQPAMRERPFYPIVPVCVSRITLSRRKYSPLFLLLFSLFFSPFSCRRKRNLAVRYILALRRRNSTWSSYGTSAAFVPGKMTEIFV